MKRLLFCVLFIWNAALAQQKPHYTQYILNQYILNPALAGIENYTDVKISHRHQWVGLNDAPVTTYFTLHSPLGKKDFKTTPTSFNMDGENPLGKRYWEDYTSSEPHHGVGVQVINDRTGPLNRFSAYGTYAYHLGLTPRTSLAAGIGVGVTNISLNANKLSFDVPVDPAVGTSGYLNTLRPDFTAGVYLYSADYFAGISAQQVVPQKVEFVENSVKKTTGKSVPHLFATAGYRFLLSDDINVIPSAMVKFVYPAPPQYEANAKIQYRDFLWGGVSYRHKDGVSAMAGINVSNLFNIGYAYDYTISRLNTFTKGTHEVVLGFLIGNQYGSMCPKNVW
jgi:type IX secretion system PorP/SprF family membrane protein